MSSEVYAICAVADIPNQKARGFQLLRVEEDGTTKPWSIVIVRWGKHILAYRNRCPHDGTNLDWERNQFLDPNGIRLMCGKHGAVFELGTGECIDGPCRGQFLEPIAAVAIDGEICITGVTLAEEESEAAADDQ
jgi:nitrite reductase/ring-hydroxylating ferredoxin subunit